MDCYFFSRMVDYMYVLAPGDAMTANILFNVA